MCFQGQYYENWRPIDGCGPAMLFGCLCYNPAHPGEYTVPLAKVLSESVLTVESFSCPQPRVYDIYYFQGAKCAVIRNSSILVQAEFHDISKLVFSFRVHEKAPICRHRVAKMTGSPGSLVSLIFFCKAYFRQPRRSKAAKEHDHWAAMDHTLGMYMM